METPKKYLAKNLLHKRKELGLTQAALADKARVSKRTIQQIEQEIRFGTDEMLAKLAHVLGTTVSSLVRDPSLAQAEAKVAAYPPIAGSIPGQLLVLIARLADQPEAIEMLMGLCAKFLGIPIDGPTRALHRRTGSD